MSDLVWRRMLTRRVVHRNENRATCFGLATLSDDFEAQSKSYKVVCDVYKAMMGCGFAIIF